MMPLKMPWRLTGALLAITHLHAICSLASPSINVALRTSFSSAPYLLELLETASDENVTSYFPLLDRIADGYFASAATEEQLYNKFLEVLQEDGHITDAQTLSSYQLALSLRSAAPRIQAHYQYYHSAIEPSIDVQDDISCPIWVLFNSKQYCSPILDNAHGDVKFNTVSDQLPFDRVTGNTSAPASILYADITSPVFGKFHKTLIQTARDGKTSYRVRHRKPLSSSKPSTPLMINGYGVELALKRTDYIVIDDRDAEDSKAEEIRPSSETKLDDQELADLKPLSTSELLSLSLKASSFVMQSENPFQTLIKLSQDFPKYSTAIAAHNTSGHFLTEHLHNRGLMVPAGLNVIWINGVQLVERQVDAFTLLDLLRRERTLINGFRQVGLTGPEAVSLLAHQEIAVVNAADEPQRFDWRDIDEGGNVIIWMNDIEKDKRYEGWPLTLQSLLQRTFPGQLPSVRRDIFNIVLPVDLSDTKDMQLVVDQIQGFIKRKLPLRFGLVPLTSSPAASQQANIVFYLLDSYGISAAIAYLEMLTSAKSKSAIEPVFKTVVKDRKLRNNKLAMEFEDVLAAEVFQSRISSSQKWINRLAADGLVPPIFVDGVAFPRNEKWLQAMSMQVSSDLQAVMRGVYEQNILEESWVPTFFLSQAASRRNPLVIPEDDKSLKVLDVNQLYAEYATAFQYVSRLPASPSEPKADWAHMVIITDIGSVHGQRLLNAAAEFRRSNPAVELAVLHASESAELAKVSFLTMKERSFKAFTDVDDLIKYFEGCSTTNQQGSTDEGADEDFQLYWATNKALIQAMGLEPRQQAILVNGRLVGPIPRSMDFTIEDFLQLVTFERLKRITPVYAAMDALSLADRIADPLSGAKVSSLVALSSISDVPEGILEQASTLRISSFDAWQSQHTAIETGDASTAALRVIVAVDPASEQAQKWIPIMKVLSELDGVYLRLFLNPKDRLQELPVKRFYRYVLDSKPTFNEDGSLRNLGASFKAVPQEALLTVGMDVPPPWLVAPKESIHDLDNIKLSNIKADVNAVYELEHILIEGHSRENAGGEAPRGAQLVLSTRREPLFADTIIMSNLGYFQFKANPGFYNIELEKGRSSDIFEIESLGSSGWTPVPGDHTTEVALMSFQGTTLYPRLFRKPGQEKEDVLEPKISNPMDLFAKGIRFAESIIGFGSGEAAPTSPPPADINIFSVASGHLYERMLNIMMVSVMKHTKHTVKFWFIEQFLSPSFKDFIPHLAAEYGFQYEMVTYKWPHWLRAQTEKQREIWGYKILFLDVLFPLSLDKVIFVDADQIVRTDMIELVQHDLEGAPYGFTPMCDSRTEMEGFRFWKQGYWKGFLKGLPYHISALYVVDLRRFRQIAAGDRLRQQYHQLSADPGSLSNLDQDLPNHMQAILPIHSLPQEWLWCETWCSDESLKDAKTIDLCNNPQTKEPKLDRARRQVPEWTEYDDEIAAVDRQRKGLKDNVKTESLTEKNTKSRIFEAQKTSHVVDEL